MVLTNENKKKLILHIWSVCIPLPPALVIFAEFIAISASFVAMSLALFDILAYENKRKGLIEVFAQKHANTVIHVVSL